MVNKRSVTVSHSRGYLACDEPPDFLPIHASVKVGQSSPDLYFRRFLDTICTSRYQKMYIKSMIKALFLAYEETLTHQTELGLGGYQCQTRVWSPTTKPSQSSWRIFPEVYILPTCCYLTKARPSAAFQRSFSTLHLSAKYQDVQ